MTDGFALRRGGFRAPRVPFDLRCVLLAAAGFLTVSGLDCALARIWDLSSPVARMFGLITRQIAAVPFVGGAFHKAMNGLWGVAGGTNLPAYGGPMSWWQIAVTAVCFVAIWSLFGGALMRTAALRLTRDEPISLKQGIVFGGRNWVTFLLAPLLVMLFAGFFTLANIVAGAVISIHGLGSSLLVLVLFPLALIASLLVVISLAGGLIGLPLIWSGIAVEQNGALEALSRAFSYIFARPFRFFFGYFLAFVLMSVILVLAGHFENTAKSSLQIGIWRTSLDRVIRTSHQVDVLRDVHSNADRTRREEAGIADIRNIRDARWYDWIGFFWMWLLLSLFMLGFKGFAIYVFLGGTVSLYLQLRHDVDGTEEEEIYPESEEQEEEAQPRWTGEGDDGGKAAEEKAPPDADSAADSTPESPPEPGE